MNDEQTKWAALGPGLDNSEVVFIHIWGAQNEVETNTISTRQMGLSVVSSMSVERNRLGLTDCLGWNHM